MKRQLTPKICSMGNKVDIFGRGIFKMAMLLFAAFALFHPIVTSAQTNAAPVKAQPEQISPLEYASGRLIGYLNGEITAEEFLTDRFLAKIPAKKIQELANRFIALNGKPIAISKLDQPTENQGIYRLEFEHAYAKVNMTVDPVSRKVFGLFFSDFQQRGDSLPKINADFAALPGKASFAIARLSKGGAQQMIASHNAADQIAIASTFKLYILAELSAQISEGKRSWSDVTPLAHRSYSSLATRGWPENSPATLQTLALQMIAISDNSASDTLLHLLGRRQVGDRLKLIGHGDPKRALPLLSTVEAFVLKGNAPLRAAYINGTDEEQERFLYKQAQNLKYGDVNANIFSSPGPQHIEDIEWFASANDIIRLLDYIRRNDDGRMLKIMSANVGIAESRRTAWQYLGYKGGSEPGVISMSYLALSKTGEYYAITGSWNNSAKEIDEAKFNSLMTRLIDQAAVQ